MRPCEPRIRKPRAGTCWRPPMDATIRSAWPLWRLPRRGSPPERRRMRSSRPSGPKPFCRRTPPATTVPRISISRRSISRIRRAASRTPIDCDDLVLPLASGSTVDMPLRAPFAALALTCALLLAVPLCAIEAAEFSPEQRQAIEAIIHDYMMQNPDVLLDALRAGEEAKTNQVLRDRHHEIFDDPATPVGGNPEGDVTIVEFFDYRCPYCKQVQPSLQALLGEDHKLRFIYKEMPVLGAPSLTAAHAALAARLQGKYEHFHAAMMATKGQITDEVIYQVAGSVGLDVDRLKRDMAAPEIEQALKANLALAKALEIHGTPGFIIGEHIVPGAIDLDALKDLVADARKG